MSKQAITAAAQKAWKSSTEARLSGVSYEDWLDAQKSIGHYWSAE